MKKVISTYFCITENFDSVRAGMMHGLQINTDIYEKEMKG